MKFSIALLILNVALWANTGCKKDSTHLISIRPNTYNTAPVANAGGDLFVWSPLYEAELLGSYLDVEKDINEVSWTKLSGPNSYVFENKNSPSTKISSLETGVYQFELTATDKMNLYDKDTVVVTVAELSVNPNEIIVKDLVWIVPWYSNIELPNFFSNVPPGSPFKIFIQRDNDPEWKEVPSETANGPGYGSYDYFIQTGPFGMYSDGSLYITYYGSDVTDYPDIKIVY